MKEKLIEKLYDLWKDTDDNKEQLLEEITTNINDGIDGANMLLDWCRCDYDGIREQYMKLHNLSEEEMEKIMEEHCGAYEFMYDEIPYAIDLQDIWDLCNWYLDYCNNDMTEEELLKLIEEV